MTATPTNMIDVKASMARLFETRDGKMVMGYLNKKYYDGPMTKGSLERLLGSRDVMLHIKQLMENTSG